MKNSFALGTVQLGLDYGISNSDGKPDLKKSFEIINTAVGMGISTLDTAQVYGESEQIIGEYSKQYRTDLKIITKIPPLNEQYNFNRLNEILSKSLNNLSANKIYGLMFHNYDDFISNVNIAIDFFRDIKKRGLVKRTGVSIYNSNQAKELLNYSEVDLVQAPMNLFDLKLYKEGLLDKMEENGVEYYIRSVFLQGLFFMPEEDVSKKIPEALPYIKKLNNFCLKHNIDKIKLAISLIYKLLTPAGSIVFGVTEPKHIISNLKLVNEKLVSNKILDYLEKLSADIPESVINPSMWRKI